MSQLLIEPDASTAAGPYMDRVQMTANFCESLGSLNYEPFAHYCLMRGFAEGVKLQDSEAPAVTAELQRRYVFHWCYRNGLKSLLAASAESDSRAV